MQQIYTARNDMEAHFVKGLLEEQGLEVVLQGEPLEGAWGDLPISDRALPSLWVKEEDVDRATAVVDEYIQREKNRVDAPEGDDDKTAGPTWKCPKCGEEVEDQFDVCWNCGTERPAGGNAAS
jgi:hypothetical protein